jgi:type I restriction enzyme, R subunit
VKLASREMLASLRSLIAERERWTEKEQTQAEVEVLILDNVYQRLPTPPFNDEDKEFVAKQIYQHVWQQSVSGTFAVV